MCSGWDAPNLAEGFTAVLLLSVHDLFICLAWWRKETNEQESSVESAAKTYQVVRTFCVIILIPYVDTPTYVYPK